HLRTLGDPVELEEERRLAYVGITRARRRLFVSPAVTRSAWGQPSYYPASRFLDEVPDELIDWERTASTGRGGSAPAGPPAAGGGAGPRPSPRGGAQPPGSAPAARCGARRRRRRRRSTSARTSG